MKIATMKRTPGALRPPFPALRWIVAAALVTLTSVACDVHSPVGPGEIASITLTPAQTTLGILDSQQLVARAFDSEGREIAISGPGVNSSTQWEVVNGGGTLDGAGSFQAGTELGTFTNTVRVSIGNQEAFASFTVIAGPLSAITVTPNPDTLSVNGTRQFTATAVDAGGNPLVITPTWSVASGGGTINASTGMFTAGTAIGTFANTVRASSGGLSGSATVTVTGAPAATITVTPNPATVGVNDTVTFTATALDANGDTVSVTPVWSVGNGGGTINATTGVFTAGATAGTFASTVRATSGSVFGLATVNVTDPSAPATITVTPNPATVGVNDTVTFTATALNANGDTASVTPVWSVGNGGGTINATTGVFTAGATAGTFASTVRATSGSVFGQATVNVTDPSAPATITVTPNPASVGVNDTVTFTATALDANGDTVSVTPVWSVGNGGGTINASTGVFTAGATAGTFANTVRATVGGAFGEATVNVTASPPPPAGIFGSAAPNGIMAGTEVTCVSLGLIDADVSIHPGSTITGYPPCTITGEQNLGNALAEQMQIDLATAFNDLAARPCPPANAIAANLGGTTLPAGVYCTASGIGVTGTLTLDGGGDPNAEFVFQAGTSLTTAGNVVLINGAEARNVYWLVGSSATLGTASQWQGNIVALTSITLVDTATLIGRALARNGAVTLGTSNTITLP